ncbi:Os12g0506800, partial [Oryza sativa Japonica Group]
IEVDIYYSGVELCLHPLQEHPHFSRPWFTLHPCGTSDCMKLLLEGVENKDQHVQYLPAWLSVVGQAVGLKIPLELYASGLKTQE